MSNIDNLPHASELKTRLPYAESSLRTTIYEAIGTASMCWENVSGAGVFQSERAAQVGKELIDKVIDITALGEPSLGCATNQQLHEEMETRKRLGNIEADYRTLED